jgi:hypothetical protein
MTLFAPLASATAMQVDALNTSMTATTRPCVSPAAISFGDMKTSRFTLVRLLEQKAFAAVIPAARNLFIVLQR